jgi:hypothetical protein
MQRKLTSSSCPTLVYEEYITFRVLLVVINEQFYVINYVYSDEGTYNDIRHSFILSRPF